MALKFYKRECDLTGILDHIILLVEKAKTGVFDNHALIRRDDSGKLAAYAKGLLQCKLLDPAAIIKHPLSWEALPRKEELVNYVSCQRRMLRISTLADVAVPVVITTMSVRPARALATSLTINRESNP